MRRKNPNTPRTCQACGTDFYRHANPNGAYTEKSDAFARRKTCSRACHIDLLTTKPHKPKLPNPHAWTPDEDRIIRIVYPIGGAIPTNEALTRAGHQYRSRGAITKRASNLRIPTTYRPARATSGRPGDGSVWRHRALALLTDYRGLPLTADDVADELALARSTAQDALRALVREGQVSSRPDPDFRPGRGGPQLLYFAMGAS